MHLSCGISSSSASRALRRSAALVPAQCAHRRSCLRMRVCPAVLPAGTGDTGNHAAVVAGDEEAAVPRSEAAGAEIEAVSAAAAAGGDDRAAAPAAAAAAAAAAKELPPAADSTAAGTAGYAGSAVGHAGQEGIAELLADLESSWCVTANDIVDVEDALAMARLLPTTLTLSEDSDEEDGQQQHQHQQQRIGKQQLEQPWQQHQQQMEQLFDAEEEYVLQSSSSSSGRSSSMSENLQILKTTVAPVLQRFGMPGLVQLLQRYIEAGHPLEREGLHLSALCEHVALLCDATEHDEYIQGMLTCYAGTAWVLHMQKLRYRSEAGHTVVGTAVDVRGDRVAEMRLSQAGDLIATVFSQGTSFKDEFRATTRELLSSCPWMSLTEEPLDSQAVNMLTLDFHELTSWASAAAAAAAEAGPAAARTAARAAAAHEHKPEGAAAGTSAAEDSEQGDDEEAGQDDIAVFSAELDGSYTPDGTLGFDEDEEDAESEDEAEQLQQQVGSKQWQRRQSGEQHPAVHSTLNGWVETRGDGSIEDEQEQEVEQLSDEGEDEQPSPGNRHSSSSTAANSEALKVLKTSIEPLLHKYGLSILIPLLRQYAVAGHPLQRSSVKLAAVCDQVQLLCDPSLNTQYAQGLITCYMGIAWVLRQQQLQCKIAGKLAPDVNVDGDRVVEVLLCKAGDVISRVMMQQAAFRAKGKVPARNLLTSCPWMSLTEPDGDATANLLTLNLYTLAWCSSNKRLVGLLPSLNQAVYTLYAVEKADASASAALVATVAAGAVAADDVAHITNRILAAAAQRAMVETVRRSSARLGRVRHMLRHGATIALSTLVKISLQESGDDANMAPDVAAALHNMLIAAGPYWVCIKPAPAGAPDRAVWLFNVPLLLKHTPSLKEHTNGMLSSMAPPSPAAAAGAAASRAALAPAATLPTANPTAISAAEARTRLAAREAAAAAESAAAAGTVPAAAAVASTGSLSAAAGKGAAVPAATGRATAATGAATRAAAAAAHVALFGPHELKRGPSTGLDYTRTLPGLGPVKVITISSASSPAYSSMLQHMSAVSIIGLDSEGSYVKGRAVVVLLAFMVPGVAANSSDPGWPDTVYLVDLVAAGKLQQGRQQQDAAEAAAASELLAGLASVFEDPSCTLVIQDASQDLPQLQSEFGITANNVIDTQLCYMLLEAVREQQGLCVPGRTLNRRRLEVLLGAYGLIHPNKMDVVQQSKANRMLWLNAPRPLSQELLSYVASDVRYLPALVLLMERDLLQLVPGALMRELQPTLPRRFQPPAGPGQLFKDMLLPQVTGQLQKLGLASSSSSVYSAEAGITLAAAAAVSTSGGASSGSNTSSTGSSSSTDSSAAGASSWIEPAFDDTRISNLLFKVNMPPALGDFALSAASETHRQIQQQRLQQAAAAAGYQLLVPVGAEHLAQQAAAAVAAAGLGPGSAQQPASAQVQPVDAGTKKQQQQEGTEDLEGKWQPDSETLSLLELLPARIAEQLLQSLEASAVQYMQQQQLQLTGMHTPNPSTLPVPQLQQLWITPGRPVRYSLGVSGVAAAAFKCISQPLGTHPMRPPAEHAVAASFGLQPEEHTCTLELLEECVAALMCHEGIPAGTSEPQHALFGDGGCCRPLGTLHKVVPTWVPTTTTTTISSSNSSTDVNAADREQSDQGLEQQNTRQPGISQPAAAAAGPAAAALGSIGGLHFIAGRPQPHISRVVGDILAAIGDAALAGAFQRQLQYSQQQQQQQYPPRSHGLAAWTLGLPALDFHAAAAPAAGWGAAIPSASSRPVPGQLLLLLGPRQSGKSSMLRAAAASLAPSWCCDVAVVDMAAKLGGRGAVSKASCLGSALQLQVNSPASQAAAIQAAWQLHGCKVVILNQLTQSTLAVAAVEAALAAGVSVIAAADEAADLAALHAAAAAAASSRLPNTAKVSTSSSDIAQVSMGSMQQQRQQEAASLALWELLVKLTSGGDSRSRSSCSVVECVPGYSWILHTTLPRSLQFIKTGSVLPGSLAAAAAPLPVQVRELLPADEHGMPVGADAVVDRSGRVVCLRQQGPSVEDWGAPAAAGDGVSSASGNGTSSSSGRGPASHAVVARFVNYGAAASELPPALLAVVRQLLCEGQLSDS